MESYRQGDVLLVRVRVVLGGCRRVPREAGRVVLAHGEATGHAHAIADLDAELLESPGGVRYLTVGGTGAVLEHEEHAAIGLAPGAYRVMRQREYVPRRMYESGGRWVQD